MSTFDGIVEEFPNIRIDYFRHHPGRTPPAACFLSHIHSDHLLGLDTLKMPFVYCSAATRRLLLKMEKYPHRINFSKGILEARRQTYKHLKLILRPLPLNAAIDLELGPKSRIRVTLIDANHCPGAVMFLIEGDGRAILYTGDIRAEPWWVNSIARSPALIAYTAGSRRLDCVYLDTTFASHSDIHRHFPTQAEGLSELSQKIAQSPSDSIFYFRAWTLGYEDVWIMLANMLRSQVHVDQYQLRLFRGIAEDGLGAEPGPTLVGFPVGNGEQPGVLTFTPEQSTRIHSCEPGMPCHTALKRKKNIVWITPIISRLRDGTEIAEIGAGGGGGDLYQKREVDLGNDAMIEALRMLCANMAADPEAAVRLETALTKAQYHQDHRLMLDGLGFDSKAEMSIKDFVGLLAGQGKNKQPAPNNPVPDQARVIHFPYSRHSSYEELHHLLEILKPKDICPCTVDAESWTEEVSMEALFGDLCTGNEFRYDQVIRDEVERRQKESSTTATASQQQQLDTQRTETESQVESQDRERHEDSQLFRSAEEELLAERRDISEKNNRTPTSGQGDRAEIDLTATERVAEEASRKNFHEAWRADNSDRSTFIVGPASETSTNSDDYEDVTMVDIPLSPADWQGLLLSDSGADLEDDVDGADTRRRIQAFWAAQACMEGDAELWSDMKIRSLGYHGHSEAEKELWPESTRISGDL